MVSIAARNTDSIPYWSEGPHHGTSFMIQHPANAARSADYNPRTWIPGRVGWNFWLLAAALDLAVVAIWGLNQEIEEIFQINKC